MYPSTQRLVDVYDQLSAYGLYDVGFDFTTTVLQYCTLLFSSPGLSEQFLSLVAGRKRRETVEELERIDLGGWSAEGV